MRVQNMPRHQVEAVARRLGIANPQRYLLPDLRAAVKVRHRERWGARPIENR
jgi:hypothetical protein